MLGLKNLILTDKYFLTKLIIRAKMPVDYTKGGYSAKVYNDPAEIDPGQIPWREAGHCLLRYLLLEL